ncbi:MAG: hypothetical protein V7K94_09125 [Nostoc sp.]
MMTTAHKADIYGSYSLLRSLYNDPILFLKNPKYISYSISLPGEVRFQPY